ncbi:beta-propeller fold lactonase family protein [Planococcus sp. APC 4015]|nr:beta-propeller fold lactonase family protein [Planococcus sp. APC 4015]
MRFLVGGHAAGIGLLFAGAADDHLAGGSLGFAGDVVRAEAPSWVTAHPTLDVVYATLESAGLIQAFRRTGESTWEHHGAAVAAGESVCHVAVAPTGTSLVASCWGDGRVVRVTLDAAGRPLTPTIAAAATDPSGPARPGDTAGGADLSAAARALRAAAGAEFAHLVPDHDREPLPEPSADARPSRAHQAVFLPGGIVATTDLGLDLVRFWRETDAGLRATGEVVLPRGSGPRHMVWHPSGHLYVVTEMSCEVFVFALDPSSTWRLVGGTPVGAGTLAGDDAAELAASRDGEFLYAGVRGSNTLATLRVRGSGEVLEPVALVDAGVDWPRHHVVVRDTVLVAGQRSDEVVSLTLDERTGVPGRVRHRTAVPSPTCILPLG